MEIHEVEGYSHAIVQRNGFEDKLVAICNGWIEAHNYIQRNGRKGMRIVGIDNIHAEVRELRDKEAEAINGKEEIR